MSVLSRSALVVLCAVLIAGAALADDVPQAAPQSDSAPRGFWERDRLLGDVPVRLRLEDMGLKFGLQDQNEVWGVTSGGLRRASVYDGTTQANVTLDAGKLLGLDGGTFYVSAYNIRGRLPTPNLVGALQFVSGIEATASLRLFDLYYEQSLLADRISIRLGQFGADEEFAIDQYGVLLFNSSFGWPGLPALTLPSGGPAYPLSTPGIRARYQATDNLSLLAAIFNGDPAGPGPGDPQRRNGDGLRFRVRDGVFIIAEAQYATNPGKDAPGLGGTYKLGAYYSSNAFDDQAFDPNGLSLADPNSTGAGKRRVGLYSIYASADQLVWKSDEQSVGVFARVFGGPSDRVLVNYSITAGANWKGPIPGRGDDALGLGVAYVRIGDRARTLDAARHVFGDPFYPVRGSETAIEATYQIQAAGWLQLQPDLQYVINPSGGVPNPLQPSRRLKNAFALGLRSIVTF